MKEPDAEDDQIQCVNLCIHLLEKLEKSVNYHYTHKSFMTNKKPIRVTICPLPHDRDDDLNKNEEMIKDSVVVDEFMNVYNALYQCSTKSKRPKVSWKLQNGKPHIVSSHHKSSIPYLEDIVSCLFEINIIPYLNDISTTLTKIEFIVEYWKTFKTIFLNTIRKLFTNMISDKTLLPDRIAFQKFYDRIVRHREEEIVNFAILTINEYREMNNSECRRKALNIMDFIHEMEHPMMLHRFFLAMLKGSEHFYKTKANEWIGQKSLFEYATQLKESLEQEQQFINRISYAFPIRNKLINYTIENLITNIAIHFLTLSGSGIHHLIESKSYAKLKFVADVISTSSKASRELGKIYKDYILYKLKAVYNGEVIELQAFDDIQKCIRHLLANYIPQVLDFFEELHIVQHSFLAIPECRQSLNDGMNHMLSSEFELTESKETIKTDLLFAFYCDEIINNHHSEHEAQEKLSLIAKLMNQFMAADIFLDEYRCLLAKRLIATSASRQESIERFMITQLKSAPMSQVNLYKLDYLIKEREKSLNSIKEFKKSDYGQHLSATFQMSLFSTGYWPLSTTPIECHLPPSLQKIKIAYESFYSAQFGSDKRVLKWLHAFSNTILVGRFEIGPKQFLASLFHAIILITFNGRDMQTFGELLTQTGLPANELVQSLAGLCSKKCRLLIASTTRLKDHNTIYRLNKKFKHSAKKIKIPSKKITLVELQRRKSALSMQRRHILEAAIVHQMKIQRHCSLEQLIPLVTKQIAPHFQAPLRQIKQRVDALVESNMLRRNHDHTLVYN
mmetsp:Transcript_1082/g.1677  ORF Transcript_1082/g.1677 Transcript_1082/m.1677 type:complete len:789 (-) Transcript_1082:577-2943(-)